MNAKSLLSLAMALGCCISFGSAQEQPDSTIPGSAGAPRVSLLPRGAEATLTPEQRARLAELEAETRTKLGAILTPEQMTALAALRSGPPLKKTRPPISAPASALVAAAGPSAPEPAAGSVLKPLPAGVTRHPVTFSEGHDTVPVDHGRPVALIAAALGVPDEVFREAFSHVHPAGPGSGGPTDGEARTNKAALMTALGKFGVTDDRLNAVSNFYRYPPGSRSLWRNQPAVANALVKDGAVIGYELVNGGYGYTTAPTVSVPGFEHAAAQAEISHSRNFEANGAVSSLTTAASLSRGSASR